jgi:hypothetical protein
VLYPLNYGQPGLVKTSCRNNIFKTNTLTFTLIPNHNLWSIRCNDEDVLYDVIVTYIHKHIVLLWLYSTSTRHMLSFDICIAIYMGMSNMTLMSYYANKGAWLMTSLYNVYIIKITMYDHISSPLVMGFNLIYILPYILPFQILLLCHICKKGAWLVTSLYHLAQGWQGVTRQFSIVHTLVLLNQQEKKLKTTKHGLVKLLPDYNY